MKIIKIALTIALGMPALFAQTYSQPVREVEKEAYSAVGGTCGIQWWVGEEQVKSCAAYTVPADKILAVRHVSILCSGRTGDEFAVNFQTRARLGASASVTYFPLIPTAPFASSRQQIARAASTPVFHHAAQGTEVRVYASFDGQQVNAWPAGCHSQFQGYLLPAVQ